MGIGHCLEPSGSDEFWLVCREKALAGNADGKDAYLQEITCPTSGVSFVVLSTGALNEHQRSRCGSTPRQCQEDVMGSYFWIVHQVKGCSSLT